MHTECDKTLPHNQPHDYRLAFFLFSIEALSLICLSRKLCFFFCTTLFELSVSAILRNVYAISLPRHAKKNKTYCTAIMIGLFLFFCAFVDELVVILFFFPFKLPNFSRPSRPFAILAIRSS